MKIEELYDALNAALSFALSNLHTITVCKVTAVNETTISCQPVINRQINGETKPLPEFIEVPPVFMCGGDSYEAYPITTNDYCILLISERCYDNWYFGNDFVNPLEMRMHDYSDGFAFVAIRNQAGAITIPDVITQIGDKYCEGDYEHLGNYDQTGNYDQEGDYTHNGNLDRTGSETVNGDRTHTGNTTQTGDITLTGGMTATGIIQSSASVVAPILSGVLTGVGGAAPIIPQPITATEMHAQNGYSGTVVYLKTVGGTTGTITFVDGICTGAT